MQNSTNIFIVLFLFLLLLPSHANAVEQRNWGIAMGLRSAKIPYATKEDHVSDIIPLMFYDGDIFFVHGLTGGMKLYNKSKWQFSLLGRYRYFDIPEEYQNYIQENSLDLGGQAKYRINKSLETNFEIMSDDNGRFYTSLNIQYSWESGSWELFPYATLRYKTADFNNYYYGLDGFSDPANPADKLDNKLGGAFDLTLGSEIRYHVTSNLYLLGRVQLTALDKTTRDSITIDDAIYGEAYLGVAFFNDKTKTKSTKLNAKPYLRLGHGWATPSNLGEILDFNAERDDQNNQLTSLFYGHPISDSLFGIEAFDIYITTGFIYHHGSDPVQQTLQPGEGINTTDPGGTPCNGETECTITYDSQPTREYILAIKAYYNFYWPSHWRLGAAEGLSYIEDISNIEQQEMDKKGYRASNLMNYLDFTLDVDLTGIFGIDAVEDLYLGVGIHHRSSMFESASAFGRIKGGSNYNYFYLQQHF
jgi:outer membrane protein